ncbi:MAG: SpoIIIAH-like family protein [Oscillospiraceae bacterium]
MKRLDRQRKITLLALSLALMVAVYLNWQYSRDGADLHIMTGENPKVNQVDATAPEEEPEVISDGDLLGVMNDEQVKNYGDAQLVASTPKSAKKYFEETRLSRQKSRDEALDTLQKSLKSAKLSDSEKKDATKELSEIIQDITTETDVENMIKAKGFVDCVAFKSGEKVTVAVQANQGELTKQEAAKVRDAVLNKTDIAAQNIVVIAVK